MMKARCLEFSHEVLIEQIEIGMLLEHNQVDFTFSFMFLITLR